MKKIILAVTLSMCVLFSSCDILSGIADQLSGVANLANCEYTLKDVTNVSVAGVNLKNITNGNIKAGDVIMLAAALKNKQVPLNMNVNINVKNPTAQQALLTAMDWILDIDGTQFATGINNTSYNVNANSTTTIPLAVNTDVYTFFSQGGIESLKNFVSSFSNDGTSSKVSLRIKPSISVGTLNIPAPSYIKLEKTTGGNSAGTTTNTNNSGNSGSNGKAAGRVTL